MTADESCDGGKVMMASSGDARSEILTRLQHYAREGNAAAAGLLFHGTCERIIGPLVGGAYDGIFWTAETPAVAQAYIPRSGVKRLLARPSTFKLEERLRPTVPDDPIMGWALARCRARWDDLEIEMDGRHPCSWRALDDWPTYGDLARWIAVDLGYGDPDTDYWEISCSRDAAGNACFMPAEWRLQGQLIILHVPDLRITPAPWSESALCLKPHNRLEDFARFARQGMEAFSMSDQLQSEHLGNVHHRAIGLLPSALARACWIAVPARRHDGGDPMAFQSPMTEDLQAFIDEASCDHQADHPEP